MSSAQVPVVVWVYFGHRRVQFGSLLTLWPSKAASCYSLHVADAMQPTTASLCLLLPPNSTLQMAFPARLYISDSGAASARCQVDSALYLALAVVQYKVLCKAALSCTSNQHAKYHGLQRGVDSVLCCPAASSWVAGPFTGLLQCGLCK